MGYTLKPGTTGSISPGGQYDGHAPNSVNLQQSAAASAANAAASAANAAASASIAGGSAILAAAAASADSAAASAALAAATLNSSVDSYLGAKVSDPAVDNEGGVLTIGDLYWNIIADEMRVYTGGGWELAVVPDAELTTRRTELFNGNGSQTDFVLPTDAGVADNIDVSVDGVVQVPGVNFSYTPGSKTITFLTGAPPAGTNNICARYGNVFATPAPATASYGGTSLTNFTIDTSTPDRRVPFTNTFPTEWNIGPGRKTVDFEFVSNGFFAAEPDNHLAVVTRCDTSVIATDVRGAGVIFGDLTWSGFDGDQAKFEPTTIIESWSRPTIALQRYIWPETTGPRNATLQDGVRYRWIIETTVQPNIDGVYIRYRLYRQAQPTTKLAWDLLVDTGDVLDASNISDMTKQGLVFGVAFPVTPAAWTIDIQNIQVTWGPCGNVVQDSSASLSKYGADLQGDLTFIGNGRKIGVTSNGTVTNWTYVQNQNANQATSWMTWPNGSSTTSNFIALNSSTPGTSYRAATYGMAGTVALLETFHSGQADPQLGVNIGAANRVATFKTTGINVLGGSRDVGQTLAFNAGTINWGGANSSNFCLTSAQNMENYCTQYYIRDFLYAVTGFTLAQCDAIEIALRPLYSLFSYVVKDLQNKKVI